MEQVTWIEKNKNPELWQLAACGGYAGNKLRATTFHGPKNLNSYWDSGHRDYFTFVNLDTREKKTVEQNGTVFDGKNYVCNELPENFALIEVSQGRVTLCTIYFRPDQIAKLLPAPTDALTEDEQIVINYTCMLKSSYGGESNLRFKKAHEYTGITADRWESAKASLVTKKLLNKAGAITPSGRNASNDQHRNKY